MIRAPVAHRAAFLSAIVFLSACGGSPFSPAPTPSASSSGEIDVLGEPLQVGAPWPAFVVVRGEYTFTITPVADFDISAEVASVAHYRSDWNSLLAPVDLALLWGSLTHEEAKDHITYSQSGRWYHYRFDGNSPYDGNFIRLHSGNVHVLPATENLARAVRRIGEGDRVRLRGQLVNVDGVKSDGYRVWWRTSLSREDMGDGSCEVLWVTELCKGGTVYR